jgi:hypothetical protein
MSVEDSRRLTKVNKGGIDPTVTLCHSYFFQKVADRGTAIAILRRVLIAYPNIDGQT